MAEEWRAKEKTGESKENKELILPLHRAYLCMQNQSFPVLSFLCPSIPLPNPHFVSVMNWILAWLRLIHCRPSSGVRRRSFWKLCSWIS